MRAELGRLAAAFTAAMLLTGCSLVPEPPEHDRSAGQSDHVSDAVMMNSEDIYRAMTRDMRMGASVIELDCDVELDDIDTAIHRIRAEDPELFWISGYKSTTGGGKTTIELGLLDELKDADLARMYNEVVAAADNIIAQIPAGTDVYGKVLFVHDYIIGNTTYDWGGAASGNNGLYGTSYGTLVQGDAICQGYAEAFQLIMNRLGIECGVATGDSTRGPHAWNYVKVNGNYYWIDLTWDDPFSSDGEEGIMSHAYFLINDELLFRTRTLDEDNSFKPVCRTLADNYFWRSGAYFTGFDKDGIGAVVAAGAHLRRAELMFATREALDETIQKLFEEDEIWDFTNYISHADMVTYSIDNEMNVLILSY